MGTCDRHVMHSTHSVQFGHDVVPVQCNLLIQQQAQHDRIHPIVTQTKTKAIISITTTKNKMVCKFRVYSYIHIASLYFILHVVLIFVLFGEHCVYSTNQSNIEGNNHHTGNQVMVMEVKKQVVIVRVDLVILQQNLLWQAT